MNLNFWPKMYYSGGGGGGGSGGGGGGAAGEHAPEEPTPVGAFRFNTDSAKLEYYDGNQWVNVTTDSPEQNTGGTRGVIAGGRNGGSGVRHIQFTNIDSTGNFSDFGDLTEDKRVPISMGSRVEGRICGGLDSSYSANVDKITISSTGNATDSNDLSESVYNGAPIASSTRGIRAGGSPGSGEVVTIDYMTFGNDQNFVDFGDLHDDRQSFGGCGSPTRGITMGGFDAPARVNYIDFITISTLGISADFGDLLATRSPSQSVMSNAVRGLAFGGGAPGPVAGDTNTIEFITIATLGNAMDFGDCTSNGGDRAGCASSTKAISAKGGSSSDTAVEYVQIMSTGNAQDFGDLNQGTYESGSLSNGHGGLG